MEDQYQELLATLNNIVSSRLNSSSVADTTIQQDTTAVETTAVNTTAVETTAQWDITSVVTPTSYLAPVELQDLVTRFFLAPAANDPLVNVEPATANPNQPSPDGVNRTIAPSSTDTSQTASDPANPNEVLISATVLTPGSDLVTGAFEEGILLYLGRDGNDTFFGFNPGNEPPNQQQQIDVFFGDLSVIPSIAIPQLLGIIAGVPVSGGSDRFILGDWKQPYYLDNAGPRIAGIVDFNPNEDRIQLHGSPADYQLQQSALGTAIFWNQGTPDPIGYLPFVYNLNLEAGYFQYEGNTPPPGPVIPQAQQIGTTYVDFSTATATDPLGNVYTVGQTSASLGGPTAGEYDAWVTKTDSNGNQLFIQQFGTPGNDLITGVTTDNDGNFYLTGSTEGDLAGPRQAAATDAWVAKYDSNGNQLWIRQFGTDLINTPFDIDVDDVGNIYLPVTTVKENPPGAAFAVQDDVRITKLDNNGNQVWVSEFGTPFFDEAYAIAVSGDGSVFSTGWTESDLAATNAGLYDVWLSKNDNNGNLERLIQFGTSNYEFPWGIDTDTQGNVYVTGWTLGDLGGPNAGSYDIWLAKYDNDLNQVWIQQFGTAGDDGSLFGGLDALEVDLDGNIYLTGFTNDSLGGPNAGSYDPWVAKYDGNGNRIWIEQFGTSDLDYATDVSVDNAGHLSITGFTEGSLGAINAGAVDAWLAKLDAESGTLQDFNATLNRRLAENIVTGTEGDDLLVSQQGRDSITGAGGSDTFVYESYKDRNDTISDFSPTEDRIDLSLVFSSPNYSSANPFQDYVELIQIGSNTEVKFNPVGDARPDMFWQLAILENVNATDLSASNFIV